MRHSLALRFGGTILLGALAASAGCTLKNPNAGSSDQGQGGSSGAGKGGSGGKGGSKPNGSGGRGGTSPMGNGGADAGAAGDATPSSGGAAGTEEGGGAGSGAAPAVPSTLWYGGTSISGFLPEQLATSSANKPKSVITIDAVSAISDVAFDRDGNAWAVGLGSDHVFRIPAAAVDDPAHPTVDLQISSDALESPANLAFDENGGLWVATRPPIDPQTGRVTTGSILRFDVPSDASGVVDLTPDAVLTSTVEGDLDQIGMLTFDADHNLWVSALPGILRFDDPMGLTGEAAVEPAAVIDKVGYDNNLHFYSVAFDADGSLWSAAGDGLHFLTMVTKFEHPRKLKGRSSPDIAVTITGGMDLLPAGGLAFDAAGDLWSATNGALFKYEDPGSLSGEVDPAPSVTLSLKGGFTASTYSHLTLVP